MTNYARPGNLIRTTRLTKVPSIVAGLAGGVSLMVGSFVYLVVRFEANPDDIGFLPLVISLFTLSVILTAFGSVGLLARKNPLILLSHTNTVLAAAELKAYLTVNHAVTLSEDDCYSILIGHRLVVSEGSSGLEQQVFFEESTGTLMIEGSDRRLPSQSFSADGSKPRVQGRVLPKEMFARL